MFPTSSPVSVGPFRGVSSLCGLFILCQRYADGGLRDQGLMSFRFPPVGGCGMVVDIFYILELIRHVGIMVRLYGSLWRR